VATERGIPGVATATICAFGCNALYYVAAFALTLSGLIALPGAADDCAYVETGLKLVTAICFFVWVSSAFRRAAALGARPRRFTAASVNVGFFVPILGFVRPYQGLRALDVAIDPAPLPEPPPRPAAHDETRGYREAAIAARPPSIDSRPAPLLAWWLSWLAAPFVGLLAIAAGDSTAAALAISVASLSTWLLCCALAALVVVRIELRLRERARKLA